MKQLVKDWQKYNTYRIQKRIDDASRFTKANKDMKTMLVNEGAKRGANLVDSSFYAHWQSENAPRIEEPTFENFMKWLLEGESNG